MAASVRFPAIGVTAVINKYRWVCADKAMENLLNAELHWAGPSGADPNPDHTAALTAAKLYGGELVAFDEMTNPPGSIQ